MSDVFQSPGRATHTPVVGWMGEQCSRGADFLTAISTVDTGVSGAVGLTARYDHDRFRHQLFADLGIDCPADLTSASAKRCGEYLAGRALAQLGQELHGHPPAPVGRSEKGLPSWPHGLAGSISHSAGRCFCLLLPDSNQLVGADTEAWAGSRQTHAIVRIVATAGERALIARDADQAVLATLLFSAKETLFKLLFPVVKRHFGFACAELCALPAEDCLHMRLIRDLHPSLPAGSVFRIGYATDQSHVTTWATAPNPAFWQYPGLRTGQLLDRILATKSASRTWPPHAPEPFCI